MVTKRTNRQPETRRYQDNHPDCRKDTPDLLVLAGAMFGVIYGGTIVMVPTKIANYYGRESFANINGFICPVQISLASGAPVVTGYIADNTGNYGPPFMVVIGFKGFSSLCPLLTTPPRKPA